MLHRNNEVNLRMDPDSPLNRAHQIERQAEKMLQNGRYDQASSCYIRAADQLEGAIQQTQNPSAILSLKLQLENLRKQPQVIKKRQQWDKHKQDSVLTVSNGHFLNEDSPDGLRVPKPVYDLSVGGGAEHEEQESRMRTESTESRFNSSEEADSLLAVIREHHSIENEQPKYRLPQLIAAIKTFGLRNRHPDNVEPVASHNPTPNVILEGHEIPTSQQKIRQLDAQIQELQSHLMQLFQVLECCEQENHKLRETVSDLQQQLEECRLRDATREENHFGMGTNSRLETPFSLMNDFTYSPPTDSLSPLEPLNIPDFEEVDDII
ncbi:nuclear receptor-binding factor 2-like [Acanthaster planci]|uniref:Nuclear receptor-binding factor 2-like n=1 Tax=Acanthaster planci TaxID=133434 RepID=A0A8B7YEX4_ACAPL|nr:nuclear receptor-binding factor 2-like [Acanthaster planci]